MISMKELNPHSLLVSEEEQSNLDILLERLNKIRALYGKSMTVTSGLRSLVEQMRINPKAPHSKHTTGQAADIFDPDQELQTWCYDNVHVLEDVGLWCEAFKATPNWVHFQIQPPHSGIRFFTP